MVSKTGGKRSLLARMAVSLGLMSVLTVTILLLAAIVTGALVVAALTVALAAIRSYLAPIVGGEPLAGIWALWSGNLEIVTLAVGLALVPVLYGDTIREEIREFRENVGTTGDLAIDRHEKIAIMGRRLAQQADVSEPEVRIVNRSRPETYALGGRDGGTIVITRGVIRALEDDELEAVLAHEVSHLANGDGRLLTVLLVPMLVAEHVGETERPQFQPYHGYGIGTFVYVSHLLGWAVVTAVTTVQLWCCQVAITVLSREREFAADRGAAALTGSPATLASALETLEDGRSRSKQDMRDFKRSAGTLDLLPPEDQYEFNRLVRTHPETDARVANLRELAAEDD